MEGDQKSNGALIGSVVIIIILIIGGIYLWKTSVQQKAVPVDSNVSQGNSTDTADMEASLNNMDLDNTDSGI